MTSPIDNFFLQHSEPNKSCLLFLRKLILEQNEFITEKMNYGMPCYYYNGKRFCYLWTDKKTGQPYILFVDGNKIEHPEIVQGDRKRMKIFYVDAEKDMDVKIVKELLELAIDLIKQNH